MVGTVRLLGMAASTADSNLDATAAASYRVCIVMVQQAVSAPRSPGVVGSRW
jgi:hypothetical protein